MRVRMFRGARFRTRHIEMNWDGQILSLHIPIHKYPHRDIAGKIELRSISVTLANGAFYEYTKEDYFPDYIMLENDDISFDAKLELYNSEDVLDGMLMLDFIDEDENQRILASYSLGTRILEYSQEIDEIEVEKPNGDNASDESHKSESQKCEESSVVKKEENRQFDMQFEQMSFLSYAMDKLDEKTADNEEIQTEVNKAKELVENAKREVQRANEQVKKAEEEKKQLQQKIESMNEEIQTYMERNRVHRRRFSEQETKISKLEDEIKRLKELGVKPVVTQSSMEKHLNDIVDFMEATAKNAGISLSNIYVRTSRKDGKIHVNVRGEITFAKGVSKLSNSCNIKATLYDANGNIEIEGSSYISRSFGGFDTFDIGWNGGTEDSWISESKIRIFVV